MTLPRVGSLPWELLTPEAPAPSQGCLVQLSRFVHLSPCQHLPGSSLLLTYFDLYLGTLLSLQRFSLPGGSDGKESACNAGDLSSFPGLGRSPGGGNEWQPTPGFLAGKFPWTEEPGRPQSMRSQRAGQD